MKPNTTPSNEPNNFSDPLPSDLSWYGLTSTEYATARDPQPPTQRDTTPNELYDWSGRLEPIPVKKLSAADWTGILLAVIILITLIAEMITVAVDQLPG